MNFHKSILTYLLCGLFFIVEPVFAADTVSTRIKVIHASTGSSHIDPQLKDISSELNSVFRYTSYRLLNQKDMALGFGQEGRVILPGNRVLIVEPIGMKDKRIECRINIRKNSKKIFQTKVLLKNNSSITIGGPQYRDGVLIFNISGSAR